MWLKTVSRVTVLITEISVCSGRDITSSSCRFKNPDDYLFVSLSSRKGICACLRGCSSDTTSCNRSNYCTVWEDGLCWSSEIQRWVWGLLRRVQAGSNEVEEESRIYYKGFDVRVLAHCEARSKRRFWDGSLKDPKILKCLESCGKWQPADKCHCGWYL